MTKLYFLSLLLFIMSCSSPTDTITTTDNIHDIEGRLILGKQHAKKQLNEALSGKVQSFTWDTLIKSPSTAVAVVEPVLFDAFGKDQILTEKPYEVYLIDGYWYISGTIPKGSLGGGFEVILSAKDGRIIRLTHYK